MMNTKVVQFSFAQTSDWLCQFVAMRESSKATTWNNMFLIVSLSHRVLENLQPGTWTVSRPLRPDFRFAFGFVACCCRLKRYVVFICFLIALQL